MLSRKNNHKTPANLFRYSEGSTFRFSTKATTLETLADKIDNARFCDQVIVSVDAWTQDSSRISSDAIERLGKKPLAVRSSAASEDSMEESLAGAHLSLTNVAPEFDSLTSAIHDVFASYRNPSPGDQVLIQAMVENVVISGVILTRDLNTGSPYYVINYDDFSGRTDTVTGGAESKTLMINRARPDAIHSPRFKKLIKSVAEIEAIAHSQELDIEFCITDRDDIYILQVRPLAARQKWQTLPDETIETAMRDVRDQIDACMCPHEGISGSTTILGEMPDWNPAEMIGTTPRPLALSLYKDLITDSVWAQARADMGYRHVHAPLMIDLRGHPFIDVRLSFNSFLPASIDGEFANNLINYQLSALNEAPEIHDKIEFEIATTCRDFSFANDKRRLLEAGFSKTQLDRFEESLSALTNAALHPADANIERDLQLMNALPRLSDSSTINISDIGRHLDDCRNFGTLPFSRLARHGFIGVLFLRSLVNRGVFSPEDRNAFMLSIRTVASDLVNDMAALARGDLDHEAFLARYGHLRPGTYDITSYRYDERPDLYLRQTSQLTGSTVSPFEPSQQQLEQIDSLLHESGYALSAHQFLEYIRNSIKARELAKFTFTKCVSDVLSLLCRWGDKIGLDRNDISYLTIEDIRLDQNAVELRDKIDRAKQEYLLTRAIRLPHLIKESDDVDVVRLPLGHPTFITDISITAPARVLKPQETDEINDKIVLIESADPGFDWIFSHGIAGLVTKHGGANSHMAIRCAEFGLPAAIGCGDRLFELLAYAQVIELNCAARKVVGH